VKLFGVEDMPCDAVHVGKFDFAMLRGGENYQLVKLFGVGDMPCDAVRVGKFDFRQRRVGKSFVLPYILVHLILLCCWREKRFARRVM
jgi:hypothetical protein